MQARRLPARHGALWLIAGFRLLRANPSLLTALTFGYFFCIVVLLLLPYVGQYLVPPVLPLLVLIVANGCRAIEQGGLRAGAELMTGWRENRTSLLRLGGLQLLASLVVLGFGKAFDLELDPGEPERLAPALLGMLAISAPVLLAFWFAPLLTGWDGIPAFKSVFFSFVACVRNWRAVAVFGLAVIGIGMVVPGALMLLAVLISPALAQGLSYAAQILLMMVLLPAVNAAVYLGYRDIFIHE
jgi:hypothetical protein